MRMFGKQKYILPAIIIFIIAWRITPAYAEEDFKSEGVQARFERANGLYDQRKFERSREIYEETLKSGVNDPVLLYNLGNACARIGDVGAAVLYYEKALRLAPRDQDIRENLSRLAPSINQRNEFFLLKPFVWVKDMLSLDAWTVLCSAFFIMGCLSLGLRFMTRREKLLISLKTGFVLFLILFVASGSTLAFKVYGEALVKTAIVMKAETLARSGPGEQFEELYKLPAGTKVRIISKPQNRWARVRLMDGRSAYLPLTEIRGVN